MPLTNALLPGYGLTRPGDIAWVEGPGSGFDTWLRSLSHPDVLRVVGLNPFEVAATRFVARTAGFDVQARVGNNILDLAGRPWFEGAVDWFQWNMPSVHPVRMIGTDSPFMGTYYPRLRFHHDGLLSDQVHRDLVRGLIRVLKSSGRVLLWVGGATWQMEEILANAGFHTQTLADSIDSGFSVFSVRLRRSV